MPFADISPLRNYIFPGLYVLGVLGILASGGGDGDSEARFPTPVLPENAVVLSPANARDTAQATVELAALLSTAGSLKTDAQLTLSDIVKRALEPVIEHHKGSFSAAGKTEDLSSQICISGTAIASYEESGDTSTGSLAFNACNIDTGISINGTINVDSTHNSTTQDYSLQFGGTLSITVNSETVTIVMNFKVTGNDGTGAYSANISYSVDGIPDGGFLVTTAELWTGIESGDYTSGKMVVHGGTGASGPTSLEIVVVPPREADVWLDDGTGSVLFDRITLP